MMDLDVYLRRIHYTGARTPTFDTLATLHRLHLLAIPYENLDIHLNRPIRLAEPAFFAKLVRQKRGGWCYEMNGLFAWALRSIGFRVHYLAGSVRMVAQPTPTSDHLVLLVELDRPYIVDVGFGDGFREPLPLAEGDYTPAHDFPFRVRTENGRWIVYNHPYGGAQRYDFTTEPYPLEHFAAKCHELQTAPSSGFVRTAVCQRLTPDGILVLRGAVFKRISLTGTVVETTLESEAAYRTVLVQEFGLDIGDSRELWARIWQSHTEWLRQQQHHAETASGDR